jgi:DNA-binding CsgD family transcriptional regulator
LDSPCEGEAKKNAELGVIIGISPETILMGRLMGQEKAKLKKTKLRYYALLGPYQC